MDLANHHFDHGAHGWRGKRSLMPAGLRIYMAGYDLLPREAVTTVLRDRVREKAAANGERLNMIPH